MPLKTSITWPEWGSTAAWKHDDWLLFSDSRSVRAFTTRSVRTLRVENEGGVLYVTTHRPVVHVYRHVYNRRQCGTTTAVLNTYRPVVTGLSVLMRPDAGRKCPAGYRVGTASFGGGSRTPNACTWSPDSGAASISLASDAGTGAAHACVAATARHQTILREIPARPTVSVWSPATSRSRAPSVSWKKFR